MYIFIDDDSNLFDDGLETENLYLINNEFGFQKGDIIKILKRFELKKKGN